MIGIILVIILGKLYTDRLGKKFEEKKHLNSFQGVIVEKKHYRGDFVYYIDFSSNEKHKISATLDLYDIAEIGDTIYKLPNSNYCMIYNNNKRFEVKCYYDLE